MLGIAWLCFLIPFPGLGMFLGWPLNMVAFILAVVAMAKGGAGKGIAQLLLSLVVSPLVYLVGVVVFAGAIGAISQPALDAHAHADKGSQQDVAIAHVAPVEITARQLYRDYEANEVAADVLYKGKRLLISGEVVSIQTDLMDKPQVHLKAGSIEQVMISGLSKEEAGVLSKGDAVLAACTGNGMILGSPVTRDCELQ
ncbi:hypothetical protein [Stenotrophomonas sp. JAI102]|uniref:OB-fold protein n=1 Tax=Stenotrophomonas sp. JAI102 TaxID=2723077 RepID=UPI0015CBD65A|nr:hypothetical protein [Stenotrophomonas sp. JAI102]NYF34733.1 asparagine N-glycosylation enzyme membrane subunit Stt3 [Stenotrophomonas sp. JAI102]